MRIQFAYNFSNLPNYYKYVYFVDVVYDKYHRPCHKIIFKFLKERFNSLEIGQSIWCTKTFKFNDNADDAAFQLYLNSYVEIDE